MVYSQSNLDLKKKCARINLRSIAIFKKYQPLCTMTEYLAQLYFPHNREPIDYIITLFKLFKYFRLLETYFTCGR